jgi:hypothetical protein
MPPGVLARARTRAALCELSLEAFVVEAVEVFLAGAACTHAAGELPPPAAPVAVPVEADEDPEPEE